jgi:L-ascorbate metabolism protein UlaG (beta-lactamase superfamily)
MQLYYIGHSAIELRLSMTSILIDPFISGNPVAQIKVSDVAPSYIIVTHAHGDHIGDTEDIAKMHSSTLISSHEIVNYFSAKGVNGHAMNPGGSFQFPFAKVKFTPAWHSSSFPDGSYGGMPMGVILEIEDKRIYHAGDTALFSDMSLIGKNPLDLALLPIGDNFTMGPEDALDAVKLLKPKTVIPIHYNTFGLIEQDAEAFKKAVETETSSQCVVLSPNETFKME